MTGVSASCSIDPRGFGDAEFLVFEGGLRVTFEEFHDLVMAAAHVLQTEFGLSKGDRVGICAQNGPGWILASTGALAMGAVVVALNSWWTTEELRSALELTDPALVVVDTRRQQLLPEGWTGQVVLDDDLVRNVQTTAQSDDARAEVATCSRTIPPSSCSRAEHLVVPRPRFSRTGVSWASSSSPRSSVPDRCSSQGVFPMAHQQFGWPCSRCSTSQDLAPFLGALGFGNKTVWPRGRFDADRIIELSEKEGITIWTWCLDPCCPSPGLTAIRWL